MYTGGAFMSPWIVREVISLCNGGYVAVIDMHRSDVRLCHMFLIERSSMEACDYGTYAMIETMVPVHIVCNIAFIYDKRNNNNDDNDDDGRTLGIIINAISTINAINCKGDIDAKTQLVNQVLDIVDLNLSGGLPYSMFNIGDPIHISSLRNQIRQVRANMVVRYNMKHRLENKTFASRS